MENKDEEAAEQMMQNVFQEIPEDYQESGIELNEQERYFFVNQENQIITYTNQNGEKTFKFESDKKRQICLEQFLAFHSYDIGNATLPEDKRSFLYVHFNGDLEVYQTMLNPGEYKDNWSWETDFGEETLFAPLIENLQDIPSFTPVIVRITRLNEDSTLYISAFHIHTFQLYAEVLLPWTITNKYNQPMLVHLSRFQKELFFEKGVKVDFYPTEHGLEPIIVDIEKRDNILKQISHNILEHLRKEEQDLTDKLIVLKFKNGERDVVSALVGTISYQYYEVAAIDEYQDHSLYEKITSVKDTTPILILSYAPDSEQLLYSGIVSFD